MKRGALKTLLILSAVVLLNGCCTLWPDLFPDRCCIKNPVEDGAKPVAGINVIYKRGGQEIIESYTSEMPQPDPQRGFTISIPGGTPYTLVLTGKDGGGVATMKLASIEYANTSDMPVTKPYFTIANQDLTRCVRKDRLFRHEINPHDDKRIWYELTVADIAGVQSIVKLIIIPTTGEVSCQQMGTISKWLNWNQDLASPRWSGRLSNSDITQYCYGVRIKKVEFDIYTDCDSIISLEWHVRIGNNQYDNLSDKDPDNPKHVRVETDVLVPLDEWPIKVWSDNFVLTDYTYPNCGTDRLPDINIKLQIGQ